jgi:GNAT superfamily N-acetyltransferase
MVIIREFQKTDAQELSSLICKTLREINSKDYSKEIIDKMCVRFSPIKLAELADERSLFVALDGSRIAGTASLKENIILSVFVDAELQGKGIGSKLMKHLEELAHKNGYKEVKLPSSITSVEFYKKLGYQKIDEKVSEFGKNIIMEKTLKDGEI